MALRSMTMAAAAEPSSARLDSDERAIYQLVMETFLNKPSEHTYLFPLQTEGGELHGEALRDRLHEGDCGPPWTMEPVSVPCAGDAEVPAELIDAYDRANESPRSCSDLKDLPFDIRVLTEKEAERAWNPGCMGYARLLLLSKLGIVPLQSPYRRIYRRAAGRASFSCIGFDKAKDKALVAFRLQSSGLVGLGNYYYLEKQDGVWKVRKAVTEYVS